MTRTVLTFRDDVDVATAPQPTTLTRRAGADA
jgi:hypothetical protein